ncbi:MAG: glutamine amidotransferase [Kiritimatiellae bacterium]|nr:glutamine amidotransferase [Kiritimatiellia bacterium]
MSGWPDIVLEHAVPTAVWASALAVIATVAVISAVRMLSLDRIGIALLAVRLAWLGVLGWCLLMPARRETLREEVRPRWIVLLDVSASMTNVATAEGTTRWHIARTALDGRWVREAARRWSVDVHPFAEDLRGRLDPADAARLHPDGTATRLRDALARIGALHRGQPVAGVLVLSDGLDTREPRDDWASGPWPFPIYTLEIETPAVVPTRPPDLRVDALDTPLRVVAGWNSRLTATISGEAPPDRAIAVRLYRNDQLLQEIPTQLGPGGGSRDVVFHLDNPAVGIVRYRVEVPPLEGETRTNDNTAAVTVQVVDAQNRLLYVEDVPRWESKYLIRALRAGSPVTPLAFVRGPDGRFLTYGGRGGMTLDLTPEQLAGFKTVVVGDLDMPALGEARARHLVDFVERGGRLVLLGGPKAWGRDGFESGPLRALLPFDRRGVAPPLEGSFEVAITDEGRAHPVFGGTDQFEGGLPPVLSVFPGAIAKPAAEVLAEARTSAGPHPLIVVHRYGQGKVAAILSESLWRWSLAPGETDLYRRFWNRLLDWLSPEQEQLAPFEVDLFAGTAMLHAGEPIRLCARVGGPDGAKAEVTCRIRTPDGRWLPFRMSSRPIETADGRTMPGFELIFTPEQPGAYQAVATAELNGRRADSPPYDFAVRTVGAEATGRPANLELLRRLAESSGGAMVRPDALDGAIAAVRGEGREEVRTVWRSLWNHWLALGALLALALLEWTIRRRANMA